MATTEDTATRYLVAEIDEWREPTRIVAIVEHTEPMRALEHGFNVAREAIHQDQSIAAAVFELSPDGSALRRAASAGYARLSTVGTRSANDMLAGLVAMGVS